MEHLVADAWKMINQASLVKKFNFLPSFLSTLILAQVVFDQVALMWVTVFHKSDALFEWVLNGRGALAYVGFLAALIAVFLVLEVVVVVFEGGLLSLVRAFFRHDDAKYGYVRGISAGLRSFLPLLEFDAFIKLFHPVVIAGGYFFLLRVIGFEYFWFVTVAVGLFAVVATVVNFLTSYARFYVVYEHMGLFAAISASTALAIDHLGTTLRLFLGTLVIYVRIILVVGVILLFPLAVTALFTWLGSGAAFWLAASIAGTAFFAFLAFVSHVNSVLEIFTTALWYRAWEANAQGDAPSAGHARELDHGDDDGHGHGAVHPAHA